MTSQDRRVEMAARMRSPFDVCECLGHTYISGTIYGMQVCAADELALRDGMRHLADLVDPTCEAEPMSDYMPSHEFSRWRCERCGAVSFAPRPFAMPRFCPGCGARIVGRRE